MLSKKIGLLLGPLLFGVIMMQSTPILSEVGDPVIATALWMISWWITEAVSISVTALLPLLLFPIFKVMPLDEVGGYYGSPIIFLFFGGFVMALALEKVNLHRRIALNIIRITGNTPQKVILGFMIATASLSMWISNTATTVVMLPIALSVINLLIDDVDGFTKKDRYFALSVMMGIAFAANSGGLATVIGTPPNSVLIGLLENEFNTEISFLKWMSLGLPISIVLIAISYVVLIKMYPSKGLNFNASKDVIKNELAKLGPISRRERHVLVVFGITITLWIFRSLLNNLIPGLKLSDTTISMLGAISMFAIPFNFRKGDFILHWEDTKNLAWGILILFGGGLALAKGMSVSGIVDSVSSAIEQAHLPVFITVVVLISLMVFLTELMSNVALVAVLAPVVAGIAMGLDLPIIYVLIPVTIASSCAFMLPMATPPNAIVFASGYIKVKDMVRVGIILNILSIILLSLVYQFVIPYLF